MAVLYVTAVARCGWTTPTILQSAIGFVTAFFDTLGIGSFATTTAAYRLRGLVPVKLLPGTLNVGHAPATIAQALIYTSIVPVDATTLVLMIVAASLGAWVGAGFVVHWPRRRIQIGMGIALMRGNADVSPVAQPVSRGRSCARFNGIRSRTRPGRQFRIGALMMLGHRPMCDPRQPTRHESDRGVSDHDGPARS
jgi:hypothetical protein